MNIFNNNNTIKIQQDNFSLVGNIICSLRWCSNWKNPPLEKTLPFTGAQILSLQISKSEGGAKKNGYYHSLP